MPLVSHGRRTLGALTLISGEQRRAFTSHDLGWAAAFSGIIALAIDTARLHDEVESRAEATRCSRTSATASFLSTAPA